MFKFFLHPSFMQNRYHIIYHFKAERHHFQNIDIVFVRILCIPDWYTKQTGAKMHDPLGNKKTIPPTLKNK